MEIDKRVLKKIIQEEIENLVNEYGPGRYDGPPPDWTGKVQQDQAKKKKTAAPSAADAARAQAHRDFKAMTPEQKKAARAKYGVKKKKSTATKGPWRQDVGPAGQMRMDPGQLPDRSLSKRSTPRRAKKRRRRKEFIPKSLEQALETPLDRRGRFIRPKKKRVSRRVPKSLEQALREDDSVVDLNEADLYEQLDPPATEEEKKAAQAALEKEQAEWEAKVARMPSEGDKLSPMQIAALSRNSLDMRIADMRKANQGQAAPASGALKERPLEVDLLEKVIFDDITAEEAKEQLPEELHQAFDYFLQKSMELRQQEAEPEDEPEEVPGLEESIYDINESDLFEIDTSCDGIKDHDQRKRCEDARRRNRGY